MAKQRWQQGAGRKATVPCSCVSHRLCCQCLLCWEQPQHTGTEGKSHKNPPSSPKLKVDRWAVSSHISLIRGGISAQSRSKQPLGHPNDPEIYTWGTHPALGMLWAPAQGRSGCEGFNSSPELPQMPQQLFELTFTSFCWSRTRGWVTMSHNAITMRQMSRSLTNHLELYTSAGCQHLPGSLTRK